jgi:hypothetical protein
VYTEKSERLPKKELTPEERARVQTLLEEYSQTPIDLPPHRAKRSDGLAIYDAILHVSREWRGRGGMDAYQNGGEHIK